MSPYNLTVGRFNWSYLTIYISGIIAIYISGIIDIWGLNLSHCFFLFYLFYAFLFISSCYLPFQSINFILTAVLSSKQNVMLNRESTIFPHCWIYTTSPIIDVLYYIDIFVAIDKLTLTHHNHQKSVVFIKVFYVLSFLTKCIMAQVLFYYTE
jgi:hypothetical protein